MRLSFKNQNLILKSPIINFSNDLHIKFSPNYKCSSFYTVEGNTGISQPYEDGDVGVRAEQTRDTVQSFCHRRSAVGSRRGLHSQI